jgi:hypothetical protein
MIVPDESTMVLAFMAGLLWGLVILAIMVCCCTPVKEEEPYESAGDLFEAEHKSSDEDDFRDFIITRLAQSQAFRSKMVNGMAKLHDTHPKIYAEVMRK